MAMAADSNPARGEVSVTIGAQAFKLRATAESVAALEKETGALGLRDIVARLDAVNLATIRAGLILFDADERAAAERKVDKLGLADLVKAGEPLVAALMFGLQKANPPGATGTKN
jgi:hypothetical protein